MGSRPGGSAVNVAFVPNDAAQRGTDEDSQDQLSI
jgi:hypothetical protein